MKLEIELDNISLEVKHSICEAFDKRFNRLYKDYKKYCDKAALIINKILDCPKEEEGELIKEFEEFKKENESLILEIDEISKASIVLNRCFNFNIEFALEEKRKKKIKP